VYIACREIGISRTLKDIAVVSNVKRKNITRGHRLLVLELDMGTPQADPMNALSKLQIKQV
jgi:transcription initiation factor TFIIB